MKPFVLSNIRLLPNIQIHYAAIRYYGTYMQLVCLGGILAQVTWNMCE